MLESIYYSSSSTATSGLELLPLLACVVAALALGLALAAIHQVRSRSTRSLSCTLAVLPAIVCVVIALVNGNVGTGVAVAGAFSLVRFRSVPGSARDMGFVFLAMCVGLACGMGYLGVAALTTFAVGGAYLAYHLLGFGGPSAETTRTLRVSVPEDLGYTELFDDVLARYTRTCCLASVKTANMGSLYKLTYEIELAVDASERELIDALRCRNGNLEVSLSHAEVGYEL